MKGGAEFWDKPESKTHASAQSIGCLLLLGIFGIPTLLFFLVSVFWWQTLLIVGVIIVLAVAFRHMD